MRPTRRAIDNPHATLAAEVVRDLKRKNALGRSQAAEATAHVVVQHHLEEMSADFAYAQRQVRDATEERIELLLAMCAETRSISRDDAREEYSASLNADATHGTADAKQTEKRRKMVRRREYH